MAQHDSRPGRRSEAPRRSGRGGLFSGLMIGLFIGLILAAALAWYLNSRPVYKPAEIAKPAVAKPVPVAPPETSTETTIKPPPSTQAKMDYTFYGILPGEKPAKPVEPPSTSTEPLWLQVAALKGPADADRLKARLALLGLKVVTQKFVADGVTLYRVRVGPYKSQDDALADIDTLAANQFDHRLIKETAQH